jgi:TPR repeat protein
MRKTIGRGDDYAAVSVVLLCEYLAKRRFDDDKYVNSLLVAAVACGEAFLTNKINLNSQEIIAAQAARYGASFLTVELRPDAQERADDYLMKLRDDAEKGDKISQYLLGAKYDAGKEVPQDYKEAAKWYQLAAEQGVLDAHFNLASLYCEGLGVSQNYSKALEWYRKAAAQGHAPSQANMGVMYAEGLGVERDFTQAFVWLTKAANSGLSWAQNKLGMMHERGEGVPQNYEEAVKWYREAADQGHEGAKKRLRELS